MPERLEEAGWTGDESISNCRLMVHYYRTTSDGRIAFGQGGHRHVFGGRVNDDFLGESASAAEHLRRDLVHYVPYAEGVEVTHAWGGPIDRTADGAPIFGRLPGRVPIVYAVGYSGNGVAPGPTAGKKHATSARAEPRRDLPLPARADPLCRRLRRSRRREAQGEPRRRRQLRRPADAPRRRPGAAGLLPREAVAVMAAEGPEALRGPIAQSSARFVPLNRSMAA
jgi:glycine/D-amino acid oxidase-like deaminating enzyme